MLLLCLFWLTFPFYLNAQDDCSVFHEGACPLEVDLFFRLIVIAIIVVCKNQIFYKNYPVIVAQNDGLCEKVICWDCTLVYFNFQCSLLFPFVMLSWQGGVTILKTSLSSYRYHYLLRWICFFSRLIVIVIPSWKHFLPLSLYRCQTSWMTVVSHQMLLSVR